MIKIEVGKKFPLTEVREGAMMDLKDEGFILMIGLDNISEKEIMNFKKGELTIDLTFVNDIIFFVVDMEDLILSDIPFHVGYTRTDENISEILKRDKDEVYQLHMFLVDTIDNTLKAIRFIGFTKEFSNVIEVIMNKQLETKFNKEDYNKELDNIYNKLSPTDIKRMSTASFSSKYK